MSLPNPDVIARMRASLPDFLVVAMHDAVAEAAFSEVQALRDKCDALASGMLAARDLVGRRLRSVPSRHPGHVDLYSTPNGYQGEYLEVYGTRVAYDYNRALEEADKHVLSLLKKEAGHA